MKTFAHKDNTTSLFCRIRRNEGISTWREHQAREGREEGDMPTSQATPKVAYKAQKQGEQVEHIFSPDPYKESTAMTSLVSDY